MARERAARIGPWGLAAFAFALCAAVFWLGYAATTLLGGNDTSGQAGPSCDVAIPPGGALARLPDASYRGLTCGREGKDGRTVRRGGTPVRMDGPAPPRGDRALAVAFLHLRRATPSCAAFESAPNRARHVAAAPRSCDQDVHGARAPPHPRLAS